MPGASGVRAGRAYIELFAKTGPLNRGLRRAQARLKAFGRGAMVVGKSLAMAGGVLGLPLAIGAKVFADFETQMANVSTMLDKPKEHMARFTAGVRAMSIEFGESTETLARGLYDILSASIAPSKAMDVLAVAVKAAKGGMTDTAVAADAITTILNSYALSADRAGDVSDLLFSIVKRGKTTFAELAPAIGMVASTAAVGGVSLEELGATLATLTRAGLRTENAVTAVNRVIASFLKPTDDAADYAKSLGFELSSATLKAEGLAGVFSRIAKLPPEAIAKLFPNIRALRGVLPALKNMEGLATDLTVMAERAGAADVAYKKMAGTLTVALARIKQAALGVMSQVGKALAGSLKVASKFAVHYGKILAETIGAHKGLVLVVAAVAVGLVAAGAAMIVFGLAVSGAASVLGLIGSVAGAILSPLGLAIGAIAVLGAYLVKATGAGGKALVWLSEKFGQLRDYVVEAVQAISRALQAGDTGRAAKILWLGLKLAWLQGTHALAGLWLDFDRTFQSAISDTMFGMLALMENAWHGIQTVWAQGLSGLKGLWVLFSDAFAKGWEVMSTAAEMGSNRLKGAMDEAFDPATANEKLWQDHLQRIKQINQTTTERLVDLGAARDSQLGRLDAQHKAALAGISEANQEARRQIEKEHRKESRTAAAALAKARQEYRDALTGVTGPGGIGDGGGPDGLGGPGDIVNRLQAAIANLPRAAKDMTTAGTFSGASAGLLGARSAMDRTAAATEATARSVEQLNSQARRGRLVFT